MRLVLYRSCIILCHQWLHKASLLQPYHCTVLRVLLTVLISYTALLQFVGRFESNKWSFQAQVGQQEPWQKIEFNLDALSQSLQDVGRKLDWRRALRNERHDGDAGVASHHRARNVGLEEAKMENKSPAVINAEKGFNVCVRRVLVIYCCVNKGPLSNDYLSFITVIFNIARNFYFTLIKSTGRLS